MANHHAKHVVVVGGGLAGLVTAWKLQDAFRVTVMESSPRLGGQIDAITTSSSAQEYQVEPTTQTVSSHAQPQLMNLISELSLTDKVCWVNPSLMIMRGLDEVQYNAPMTIRRLGLSLKEDNREVLKEVIGLNREIRRLVHEQPNISALDWAQSVRGRNLVLDLISAINGCNLQEGEEYQIGQAFGMQGITGPVRIARDHYRLEGGFRQLIDSILDRLEVNIVGTKPVVAIRHSNDGFDVSSDVVTVHADYVVMACPPAESARLLPNLPWSGQPKRVLEQFNVQSRRVALHTDSTWMPRNPAHWSSFNIVRSADRCQMTVWCSQYNEWPISIFRSWLFEDGDRPDGLIKQRSYSVPIMDASFVGAQKELARLQGRLGLWFAGSYVQGSNNLQSAYLSALAVVESIAAEEL